VVTVNQLRDEVVNAEIFGPEILTDDEDAHIQMVCFHTVRMT
jgi:hypothetical protein